MAKEPVPHDVMILLIQLTRKGPDRELRDIYKDSELRAAKKDYYDTNRSRFNATFSVCVGLSQDHPQLALHWLDALKFEQNWRRVKKINALSTAIIHQVQEKSQLGLFPDP